MTSEQYIMGSYIYNCSHCDICLTHWDQVTITYWAIYVPGQWQAGVFSYQFDT